MGDRILVQATEEDPDLGITYRMQVTRSAAGKPGGFVTISRVEDGNDYDELCIEVPDLSVLAPAVEWARGKA